LIIALVAVSGGLTEVVAFSPLARASRTCSSSSGSHRSSCLLVAYAGLVVALSHSRKGSLPVRSAGVPGRIARVWKGYGTAEGVERYWRVHFAKSVLPQLEALDGFLDATVLVRPFGSQTEVVVVTVWDSIESVKAFAGARYRQAVVEPVVRDLLEHFDDEVAHFSVAVTTAER
jgi:heme-degrading monooxygenase HmoA